MRTLALVAMGISFSTPAWALDGYQDRRGAYAGLAVGGGLVSGGGDPQVGFRIGARVGGGLSQQLTADIGIDYGAIPELDSKTLGFDLAANFFPLEHAFVRAGAGLAMLYPDVGDKQAGLGAILGAGVEAFFGADMAGGFALTYEPEFYGGDEGTIHQFLGTVAISWY
ncbi:MAG: hypothetical protein AABZ30_09155 [Myxococcota bacterium]